MNNIKINQDIGLFKDNDFTKKIFDSPKTPSVLSGDKYSESKNMELYLKLHIANHRPG